MVETAHRAGVMSAAQLSVSAVTTRSNLWFMDNIRTGREGGLTVGGVIVWANRRFPSKQVLMVEVTLNIGNNARGFTDKRWCEPCS